MGVKTRNLGNSEGKDILWQAPLNADGSTIFNLEAGKGYFINTTGGEVELKLPTGSIGDQIEIMDFAGTFNTNNVRLNLNGQKLNGSTNPSEGGGAENYVKVDVNNTRMKLVFSDSDKGWMVTENESKTSPTTAPFAIYTEATGGTIVESGDFKTHIFTGDANFIVSTVGDAGSRDFVDYFVVAGGGGGGGGVPTGGDGGGGGGAGGFRLSEAYSPGSPTMSPLANSSGITVTAQTYPITVGGGGAGVSGPNIGNKGSNSVFSTITSTGGGGGDAANNSSTSSAMDGGSGGGQHQQAIATNAGTGNSPPVSPPQGNNGGGSPGNPSAGGGGGAGAAGQGALSDAGGVAGAGSYITTGCFVPTCYGEEGPVCGARYFAGGGGGAGSTPRGSPGGAGGVGGGGNGSVVGAGSANTGGGAGGHETNTTSGAGGKGIVVLRYKFKG